jgi:hypothetical protein
MSAIIRSRSAPLQEFIGGLNNYYDQSSIQDFELAALVNFEVSLNGALSSRPPIYVDTDNSGNFITTPAASEPLDFIGTYIEASGARYAVGVTDAATWILDVETKAWTQVAVFRATDVTQFQNKIVLASAVEGQGGYWENGTFTNTPTMPALGGIELFQNRFFGYGLEGTSTANTIYWSDITTFGPEGELTSVFDWENANGEYFYVEIGSGDGQWITAIDQGYNDIVIFRNRSTYRYSYGELPEEGQMQPMQQNIGAETKRSVVKFENAHFVLSGGTLYKYQNWLYYPLNAQRVTFQKNNDFESRFEHSVSIVDRRCIVWHDGRLYSYNIDNGTWSEWQSLSRVGYFLTIPRESEDAQNELYFGISGDSDIDAKTTEAYGITDYSVFRIRSRIANGAQPGAEEMTCYLQTKIFDFDTPVEFKRLYFWAADITTARQVRAIAYPVAITERELSVHWDELSQDGQYDNSFYNWDELSKDSLADKAFRTWDEPKTPGTVETTIDDIPTGLTRMEVKLDHALRFRRISFELYLTCDGTASTSPAQVFSIIPMIGVKAKIAKEAN